MAEEARGVVAQAGQPALELIWGQAQLRINNPWLAAGFGIGAFYLANKALTMLAVRRAVERREPNNPDQPADPQVGLEAEVDSLLVPVIFYSQLGYQYFTSILNGPFLKACLQTELEKVGYKEPIDVRVEKWELPNLPEGGAGLMGMMGERVLDWVAELPEKMSELSTAAGDSGIPEDVSSEAAGTTVTSQDDVEEEEGAGPSPSKHQEGPLKRLRARLWKKPREGESTSSQGEKKRGLLRRLSARLRKGPPTQVPGTSQQAELQEGPLKRKRARLLKHKDSPTAQTWLKAYSCLERGVAMATSGGHKEGEGMENLLEGIMLLERASPDGVNQVLYDQSWLHLDKQQLDKLISKQLQASPDSTPCLLIQALQLPRGHKGKETMNHVIDVVLQHGETDHLYKHLAYMYCALGLTIWETTKQTITSLSACASALMYKSDHLPTLFFTAVCSRDVSVPQAIRQFHHYIHTAPTDHDLVPLAHYHLVILYHRQDPSVNRDRILHHYNMAQQADRNRLPVFPPVHSGLADRARRVYEQVMAQPDKT